MSNEQKVTSNEQKITSNEQKLTSKEQRAKSFTSLHYKDNENKLSDEYTGCKTLHLS